MTTAMDQRAEVLRLARVLAVAPEELEGLVAGAATSDLRALRVAVSDRLLERSRRSFERAVALADRLPGSLAAHLAQHAMGPVLGARAAALLVPDRAADLATRLPSAFLADVATHVDLRHAGALVSSIPLDTLAQAGAELRRREEWVVLGAFVGHLDDDALAVLLDGFDGEALLRAGFMVEDVARLDAVVGLLTDERVGELLAAADEHDLWPEAIALVGHLGRKQGKRIVAAIERLGEEPLEHLRATLTASAELRLAAAALIELAPPELRALIA